MDQNGTTKMPVKAKGMDKSKSNVLAAYVMALRPWSFSASMIPVALGTVIAYKVNGDFNVWILLSTCLTAISVHAAGNLVNTYYDHKKGIDTKKSDDRTLVDHILEPKDVVNFGAILYIIGCIGFLITACLSKTQMEHIALIYFGGLSGSFLYTGGLGLKYIALGDIAIFLTFGPVTVLFAFLSQGGDLSNVVIPLLYAIPLALNTEAILHSNNARDMAADKQAGIVTLAILLGKTGSYVLFTMLLFCPYIIFAVLIFNYSKWFVLPTITVFLAFEYERQFRKSLANMPQNIAKLNLLLGLLYIVAVSLVEKGNLPGF